MKPIANTWYYGISLEGKLFWGKYLSIFDYETECDYFAGRHHFKDANGIVHIASEKFIFALISQMGKAIEDLDNSFTLFLGGGTHYSN